MVEPSAGSVSQIGAADNGESVGAVANLLHMWIGTIIERPYRLQVSPNSLC
jgi:hypothetical protein